MTPKEFIIDNSSKMRGIIIHEVSYLERYLDVYISDYFCNDNDKSIEMANVVLGANRISLDGKRKLFDSLIINDIPDFKIRYPTFNKDMNNVMYQRNSFAHNVVNIDPEAIKKHKQYIGLRKFSSKSRTEWYTWTKVNKVISDIRRCRLAIIKVIYEKKKFLGSPIKRNKIYSK